MPGTTDPPIVVGDGSIYMAVKGWRMAWNRWTYHAPEGHEGEALSWSAPGRLRLTKIRLPDNRTFRFPRHASRWAGLLTLEYSDGARVQLRAGSASGTGVTIVSSRPRRDYLESVEADHEVLRAGGAGIRVTRAYLSRAGTRDDVELFEAREPFRVEVFYERIRLVRKHAAERKAK